MPESSLSIKRVFFDSAVSIVVKMLWNRLLLNPDSNPKWDSLQSLDILVIVVKLMIGFITLNLNSYLEFSLRFLYLHYTKHWPLLYSCDRGGWMLLKYSDVYSERKMDDTPENTTSLILGFCVDSFRNIPGKNLHLS